MDEIGNRQGILTNQNPLLLDYIGFESAEDVRRRFILCETQRVKNADDQGDTVWIWRNPTLEEAEDFFQAYEVGVQYAGELLIEKGLW